MQNAKICIIWLVCRGGVQANNNINNNNDNNNNIHLYSAFLLVIQGPLQSVNT